MIPRGRRRRLVPLLALAAALPWLACDPAEAPPEPTPPSAAAASEEHVQEVEAWRQERRESLLSEDGWFSLVGLHWLEPGANTFGSGENADLVFPAGTPERIGTFHLDAGEVTLEPAPEAGLRRLVEVEGEGGEGAEGAEPELVSEPVTGTIPLAPDVTGDPTELELGTLSFYVIERGGKVGVRVKDSASPARAAFEGLEYYPLDPAWRVEARLEPEEGATVAVPNVLGQVEDVRAPGVLVFRSPEGEELRLTPMQDAPGDELFVVFGDATNGKGTYGGGRFLYAEAPDEEGRVVLDFNRSYNPPCAFTPYATCPLPPDENELSVPVEAGEKSYAGEIPH